MPRHPAKHAEAVSRQVKVAEEYINFIAATARPIALTLSAVDEATARDETLQAVIEAMQTGRWHDTAQHSRVNDATFNAYKQLKDEVTIGTTTHVILRETRLVIPRELQRQVVDLAHEGHQGITKTKALLREKVWFPASMNSSNNE